jgi:DNA topoisomerase-1
MNANQTGRMQKAQMDRNAIRSDEDDESTPGAASGEQAAKGAGLCYVTDAEPGIRRVMRRGKLAYLLPSGKAVRDAAVLDRIKKLVIPPAWADVWICQIANGHLQATGRDARDRKQYRYHTRWREARDESKFGNLADFVRVLPSIRNRVAADLELPGLPREKVLATVVRLLETTSIRIGNRKYARDNGSFGLTTFRNRHVRIRGENLQFKFRGKSGVEHHIELDDKQLAGIVRRCRDLPGYELFQYVDEAGAIRNVTSSDVNDYIAAIAGDAYTAKHFRTWAGTLLMALALRQQETPASPTKAKRNVAAAVRLVAAKLGNTPAICRRCYVHPAIIESYLEDGQLPDLGSRPAKVNGVASRFTRRQELSVLQALRPHKARMAHADKTAANAVAVRQPARARHGVSHRP